MYNLLMDKHIKDALGDSMRGFRLPRYHELPDMGLYLEQTTKYINQCIEPLGFSLLTGSMIRNYIKQGLVLPPENKQYCATQIAHLIAIVLLKQVLPLEHVGTLFIRQEDVYAEKVAYDYFCEELENILYFRFGLKEEVADIGVTSSLEKEMLRSAIIALSHIAYLNCCIKITS